MFYTAPFVGTAVAESLERAGIPFEWLKDAKSKQWQPGHDSVKWLRSMAISANAAEMRAA